MKKEVKKLGISVLPKQPQDHSKTLTRVRPLIVPSFIEFY
jgi:hypothetical protein